MRALLAGLVLMVAVFLSSQGPGSEGVPGLESIKHKKLKALAAHYTEVTVPFAIQLNYEGYKLEADEIPLIVDTTEMMFFNEFHASQVFYQPNFFGLITYHDYSPGAGGVFNSYALLRTYDYKGKMISDHQLACMTCSDSNMGSDDFYSTSDSCFVTATEIRCQSVVTHGDLGLSEEPDDSTWADEVTAFRWTCTMGDLGLVECGERTEVKE